LSGKSHAAQLPEDLKTPFAADWDNAVTRLCAGALAVSRERAKGRSAKNQFDAFDQIKRDPPSPTRSTTYSLEWNHTWQSALWKKGLHGLSAAQPNVQRLLTPEGYISAAPISATPAIAGTFLQLVLQLSSGGDTEGATALCASLARVVRQLMDREQSAAVNLACADVLVRIVSSTPDCSPTKRETIRRWRDEFRSAVHSETSATISWTDITNSPPVAFPGGVHLHAMAGLAMAASLAAMTLGAWLACCISLWS